ncbi:MAG: hypothetical protein EZS28_001748 [Streblomastix strix]|uniref:GH18 domain-containing protein n=1 Tax=Streblomastix strix TaxID=222440 RepID=A0A5J4X7Y3_9EUKA|nr:MAG: hypothetical protein EZS28_001748 [Streblomastix strix]
MLSILLLIAAVLNSTQIQQQQTNRYPLPLGLRRLRNPGESSIQIDDIQNAKTILQEFNFISQDKSSKSFSNKIFSFIRPNTSGFQEALEYLPKFSILSPRWYSIKSQGSLHGQENVDESWIQQVRELGTKADENTSRSPIICPSVTFANWTKYEFIDFAQSKIEIREIYDALLHECKLRDYDGLHLNLGNLLYDPIIDDPTDQSTIGQSIKGTFAFLRMIGSRFHDEGLRLYVSVAPNNQGSGSDIPQNSTAFFSTPYYSSYNEMLQLTGNPRIPHTVTQQLLVEDDIDGVIIEPFPLRKKNCRSLSPFNPVVRTSMLYLNKAGVNPHSPDSEQDKEQQQIYGHNEYILDSMIRLGPSKRPPPQRVFFGLSFLGVVTSKGRFVEYLDKDQFLYILSHFKTETGWDSIDREQWFMYKQNGIDYKVYFPSIKGLKQRIDMAFQFGCGVAVFNLGDGLDYFMDLL